MRHIVFMTLLIGLTGCSSGKAEYVTTCQKEADKFYQGYRDDDSTNPRGRYIIECMASNGYSFDITPASCDSRHPLVTQGACYVSATWLGRIVDFFRTQ